MGEPSWVDRFLPPSADYRTAAWARSIVVLSLATAPFWVAFAAIGLALGMPAGFAAAFAAFSLGHLAIPVLFRRTGALYPVILAFGALCLAGVSLVACLRGGFPFEVLLWTMALPVAVASQRLYRSLVPIWTALCLAQYGVWFALAETGHAPAGLWSPSPAAAMLLDASSLVSWVVLMMLVARATARVTFEFAEARDAYQHAVLQAQKLDAVGKLAGGIENTFNNALMSMDYATHLLEASVTDPEARGDLDDLKDTIRRSKALSRKLERLGRDDNEVLELIAGDAAIGALHKTLDRLVPAPLALRVELGAPEAFVRCDANQLDQVLVNLVVNARDAMPSGGEIRVVTEATTDRFVVEVRDTGTGIPPDALPHVFEPFFTTKPRGSGTGLGLWVCRSIAETRGGTLTATSEVGVGTVMRLELPRADPDNYDTAPVPRPILDPAAPAGPALVLDGGGRIGRLAARLAWFSERVAEPRARVWGSVVTAIAFASLPFWLAFAAAYAALFGPMMALCLIGGAVASAATPFVMRITRSSVVATVMLGLTAFTALSSLAIARGGFQIQILVWTAIMPIGAAHQIRQPWLTRGFAMLVIGQCAVLFALAATGHAGEPVVLAPALAMAERLAGLVGLLALLLLVFRAASRATEQFARERDNYEAALARARDSEMLGTFAGSIAHDLNNVLTTLHFSTEMLAERVPADSPSQEDIAELRRGDARIRELARQLTRFGRSSGGDEHHAVPDAAIATLRPLLAPIVGSNVEIVMDLDAGAAAIPLRGNALDQMIINLVLNAREAMPDGGRLTIATRATADTVEISLADTGRGIPPEIIDRVCEPFFTTADDHVGLGLWVCRETASEARGTLAIESGAGTRVRVTFPRATIARGSRPMHAAAIGAPALRAPVARPPSTPISKPGRGVVEEIE